MIYLDNSATTALCPAALDAVRDAFVHYGNPSSLHSLGLEAEERKAAAKDAILASLGARGGKHERVIFTSGGTEANNLAVFGTARAKNFHFRPRIVTTDSEHACVMGPTEQLEKEGFEIVRLHTVGGRIDEDELLDAIDSRTVLLSIMRVNNETGAVYDVRSCFQLAKRQNPGVICHTDAVQGYLKTDIQLKRDNIDMITISSHKIHGPKGCGALVVSDEILRSKKLAPIIVGGGQEGGLRSGTENMPGICGFSAAISDGYPVWKERADKMDILRRYLIDRLPDGYRANLPSNASPNIISITSPHIKSETMLHYLSSVGICVSSGSACSSHGAHGSFSLTAFGLDAMDADCTIRVSLCHTNTTADIDALLSALDDAGKNLIRVKK